MKIAINGLGRIGRIFLRQVLTNKMSDFEIVAINDLADKENLLYLLGHDSVYGKFDLPQNKLDKIQFSQEKDPAKLPWGDLGVDVVLESTGVFASYEKSQSHLKAGAKRVMISAPVPIDDDRAKTFTPNVGVEFVGEGKITSNASCTTNAVAPIASIMMKNPGVKKAVLNTVHGYTATQNLVDGPSKKDYRRGRAAAINIVPSATGAAIATSKALPDLNNKFDGMAMRVPVVSGSIVDFTFISEKRVSTEEINNIFKEECRKPEWQGIIRVTEEPLTSTDILKDPFASIVDLSLTRVVDGDLVKVLSWYDNEWGYCAMLIKHIQSLKELL
ncbi:MAG: glyceraldehyde 3-phosphate dehydrogenase NAD-binding domain-containing protein [Patescibacteria group bacterium]